MSINWFGIVAQMVNFLILLWLLKKFFYKPVLQVMKDRQERINQLQMEAQEKMEQANDLIRTYLEKKTILVEKEEEIMEQAKSEAMERKEELLAEYKEEASNKRKAYLDEVAEEREAFLSKLRKTLSGNAVILSEHILKNVAGLDLQEIFYEDFLNKVEKLDESVFGEKSGKGRAITLRSAYPLDGGDKDKFRAVLASKIQDLQQVEYVVKDDFVLGYELQFETMTISSHLRKYLDESEKNLRQVIEEV
jgi:F-type H+-transporting ATPase subunit b